MPERRTTFANVISLLGALVATSVVLGLLGAGLMMPTVAATGAAARQGVAIFDALPGEFTQNPLSQQSKILASDGSLIATPYDENRVIVPLSQIAPIMRQAQIAIEDSRFYEHGGVDPQGMGRALVSNLRGGDTQGASTLTQQYVKITLQENALRNDDKAAAQAAIAKNYTRKLQELKYAVTLEKTLTKDQILQGYLNLVYYGGQAYGVEAAAQHYFGIKASKLNLQQAATLAGLVQLPSQTDPIRSPGRALARRNVVLDRMHDLYLITDADWAKAKASKLVLHPKAAQNSCSLSRYPYFCNYIKAWLLDQPALGKTAAERAKRINRGGLTIQTTLDPKIQRIAQKTIDAKIPRGNSDSIGAAAAIIEPGTGHVIAIAQNSTYSIRKGRGKTSVNWAVDSKYGNSIGFAIGSTAKMFAVATAIKSGMTPSSIVFARQAGPGKPAVFTRGDFHSSDDCKLGAGQTWPVQNDEGSGNGAITLADATARSVNTAFAGLVAQLGACKVRAMMTNLGLHQGSGKPIQKLPAPITLGSDSVSPLTLASAYSTIAAGGIYCVPSPVESIATSDSKPLDLPKKDCRRAVSKGVASQVTEILKTVLTRGTARGVGGLAGGRPVAGKTGTSEHSNETWFVGYTPQLCTAVWVGTPTGDPNRTLGNLHLGGTTYGGQIFGATIAAPTWKIIMDRALAGKPFRSFGGGGNAQGASFVPVPKAAPNPPAAVSQAVASPAPARRPATPAAATSRSTTTARAKPAPPAPTAKRHARKLPKCRPGGPSPCRRGAG
jgi:membrane peptidoglycan carboxypeptidase